MSGQNGPTAAQGTGEYHGLATTALRRTGRDVDDAVLANIWPTHHESAHFYGTRSVGGELSKLDAGGPRERGRTEDPSAHGVQPIHAQMAMAVRPAQAK